MEEVQKLYSIKAQLNDDFETPKNTVVGNSSVYDQISVSADKPLDLNLRFLMSRSEDDLSG